MEPISAILATLLSLISPVGFASDRLAETQIRKQLVKAESLKVRIDNAPTYQLLSGKVSKVRLSGQGLFLTPDLRIEKLELETDPIALSGLQAKLESPLQGAFRLVLTEADINRALASPQVTDRLKNIGSGSRKYQVLNPQIKLLPDQRLKIQAQLVEGGYPSQLNLQLDANLNATAGKVLSLDNPTFLLNNSPINRIVLKQLFPSGIPGYDLTQLESQNITARILKLDLNPNGRLEIIGFLQIRPAMQDPQPATPVPTP
jgi:LmeA-like phospholipid-binding